MGLKGVCLYIAYAVGAFLILSVLLFPGKNIGKIMENRLNGLSPQLQARLNPVTLVLPFSLKIQTPEITIFNTIVLPLESVVLSLDILTAFKSDKGFDFTIKAFNGVVAGHFSTKNTGSPLPKALTSTFTGIKIPPFEKAMGETSMHLGFTLDGSIDFQSRKIPESARGNLHLSEIITEISTPILEQLGLFEFHFTSVDVDYAMDKNKLEIKNLKAVGKEVSITLEGNGIPAVPMEKSRLNLRGKIRPEPSFITSFAGISSVAMLFQNSEKGGIPFTISGTMEKPIFKL